MPTLLASGGPLQVFIVQLLAFVLLVAILWKFVGPVLSRTLKARSAAIEETFQQIERETSDAARELADYKEKLARIELESKARMERTLQEAVATRDQVLADAQIQVQAALEKARREVQIERDKAVLELRQEATTLTLRASEQLIQSLMNENLQSQMVDRYLTSLEAVKKP